MQFARVTITLDAPRALGCIKLWNYSKTPTRGARDIQILVDGLIVFEGALRAAPGPQQADGRAGARSFAEMVPFNDGQALRASGDTGSTESGEQDEQFTNNGRVKGPWVLGRGGGSGSGSSSSSGRTRPGTGSADSGVP